MRNLHFYELNAKYFYVFFYFNGSFLFFLKEKEFLCWKEFFLIEIFLKIKKKI